MRVKITAIQKPGVQRQWEVWSTCAMDISVCLEVCIIVEDCRCVEQVENGMRLQDWHK